MNIDCHWTQKNSCLLLNRFFCVRIFAPVPCHSPAKGGWNHAASDPLLHSEILPPAGFSSQGHGKRRSSRCQKSRPAVRRNHRQRRGKLLDLRSHGESMAPAAQDHPRQSVPNPEGQPTPAAFPTAAEFSGMVSTVSSEQAAYRSLPHQRESSLAALLLLFKSQPLRRVAI